VSSTFPADARRSGNSLVVTIPYNVAKHLQIKDGTALNVTVLKIDEEKENNP